MLFRSAPTPAAAPPAPPPAPTPFSGPTPTGSRLAPRPGVPTPAAFPPRPATAGAVVIGSADDLPTLDTHTTALHSLAERDDCSVEELEQFLAKEPGLISVVLRTSNSAYYRSPKIITNLRDAIVRMGVRHTVAVLLEATMQRSLQLPSAQAQRRLAAAWANARLTARLTRRLAQWGAFCRPEDAYLAGLMHNLGEWVLIWRFFRKEGEQSLGAFTAEGPKIIAQHEVVGQATALKWGMPPLVQSLCGAHHQPRRGELPRDRSLRLSALASWTLARALLGEYLQGYPEADVAAAIEPLGLTPNVKTALTTECALCVSDLATDGAPLDAVVAALRT